MTTKNEFNLDTVLSQIIDMTDVDKAKTNLGETARQDNNYETKIVGFHLKPVFPKRTIFIPNHAGNKELEFSPSKEMLLLNLEHVLSLKYGSSIYQEEQDCWKWSFMKRINPMTKRYQLQRPINVKAVFEHHYKEYSRSGFNKYVQTVGATDFNYFSQYFFTPEMKNKFIASTGGIDELNTSIILHYSLLENIASEWTIELDDGSQSFIMPINEDIRESIIKIRDNPVSETGRKKSILHEVQKHVRQYRDHQKTIKTHVRGIERFTLEGFNFEIVPPMMIFNENESVLDKFKGTLQYDVFTNIKGKR